MDFSGRHPDPSKWYNFPEWLRGDSSTYWINGKAGSGKSTLMAHILHEKGLRDNLEIWSRGNEVHVLTFFFWRAGSYLQKTVSGMLRSLLYQLLEEVPSVADILVANLRMASGRIPLWTERTLVKLLQAGIQVATSQTSVCSSTVSTSLKAIPTSFSILYSGCKP